MEKYSITISKNDMDTILAALRHYEQKLSDILSDLVELKMLGTVSTNVYNKSSNELLKQANNIKWLRTALTAILPGEDYEGEEDDD